MNLIISKKQDIFLYFNQFDIKKLFHCSILLTMARPWTHKHCTPFDLFILSGDLLSKISIAQFQIFHALGFLTQAQNN